jgi:hypothetical protein
MMLEENHLIPISARILLQILGEFNFFGMFELTYVSLSTEISTYGIFISCFHLISLSSSGELMKIAYRLYKNFVFCDRNNLSVSSYMINKVKLFSYNFISYFEELMEILLPFLFGLTYS